MHSTVYIKRSRVRPSVRLSVRRTLRPPHEFAAERPATSLPLLTLPALYAQHGLYQTVTRPSIGLSVRPWASAHMGKWGQMTHAGKMDEKLKAKTCKKEQFPMFMLYFESKSGQAGVENGAMLTTYLFRQACTSECTIS